MTETARFVCALCRYPIEPDDVAIRGDAKVTCLRCYGRNTDTEKPMPKDLQRQIQRAVNAPE